MRPAGSSATGSFYLAHRLVSTFFNTLSVLLQQLLILGHGLLRIHHRGSRRLFGPFGFLAQAAVLQRFDIRCRSACGSCGMFCSRNSPSFLSPCSHIFAQWVAAFQAFRRGIHRREALEDVAHAGIPVHSYAADREKQIATQNTQKQYGHQRKPRYKNTSC
jgi:hypothetical protein